MKNICVFASSSEVDRIYRETARNLGVLIASNRYTLVYGGVNLGLMGIVADNVKTYGGNVIGIIPDVLSDCTKIADEIIGVRNLQERKSKMTELSDAFIALPGGIGTLDEITTVLADKAIGHHEKPLVIINTNGFYTNLIEQLRRGLDERFIKSKSMNSYYLATDPEAAMIHLNFLKYNTK